MTTSARKVAIGKPKVGGAIFFAKASDKAPLPTSARTPLDAKFKSMGYAASEGLKRAIAKAYEVIRAWGGDEVARPRTELTITITFTLIESRNGEVAKAIFGEDAVTITAATATEGTRIDVAYEGEDGPNGAWVPSPSCRSQRPAGHRILRADLRRRRGDRLPGGADPAP